jgi:ATP-binding cassette subfamily C (CFTR/MRP) protein 1
MGISFIIGFVVMIIFLIINYYYRKQFSKYLKLYLKMSDKRMRVTTETFNNLKVIKLYGWDDLFLGKIQMARNEELDALNKRYYITTISQTLLWLAPIAMSVSSIGLYQYINKTFKVEDMFTCLAIFTSIQNPMRSLPTTFDIIMETIVSMKRIEYFLKLPEIQNDKIIKNDSVTKNKGIAIQIINGTFKWGKIQSTAFEVQKSDVLPSTKKNNTKPKLINSYIQLSQIPSNYQPLKITNNKDESKLFFDIENDNNSIKYKDIKSGEYPKIENANGEGENNKLNLSNSSLLNYSKKINKEESYLKNINLTVKQGEFICIIGEVGSGKSSLVQAILNNMISLNNNNTKIIVNGKISYVGQEAWIQNNTVQNNILFYQPYDPEKYHNILKLCELNQDLNTLTGGDLTEIGEKGVNLSGGQKARISLARAMYCDNDIFILDDPISALDAHVGKNIMHNCIIDYLKGKTRILVTHALQYTSFADKIYYMKNGEIKWEGQYKELIKQHFYSEFAEKINSKINEEKDNINKIKEKQSKKDNSNINANKSLNKGIIQRITKDEGKEIGKINKEVFLSYFSYIGGIRFGIILLFTLITWQGLRIISDLWLGYWSEHQGEKSNTFFFIIYGLTAMGGSLFNYLRTRVITSGSINCSTKLHNQMITSLIKAPINLFHDTIPKGQIFNRLSKDLPTVDTYTMYWFMTLTAFGSSFLGAVFVCSLYEKECLFFLPIFIILCWYLYRFYINCSRELNRIEGVLNSPILNLVNETIPGTATIRAYNLQNKYIEIFQNKVDEHYKLLYYINGTGQWYLLCLNLLSMLFLSYMVIMTLTHKNKFTPKIIGIILTYSLVLQEDMIEFLSSFSNFENTMTKMERSLSYTHIISERAQSLTSDLSLRDWPSKGEILFENFNAKYRSDTEMVLKNINFHLKPGEHLGIVGRTGSGKSTISLCLFRILEAFSGKIYIDGVDISKVGLNKLRRNITIIPQDSTLMNGTLRYNIDPASNYTDIEIVSVMKKIGFDYIINQNKEGLDQNISENGSNLSIGEKQLICITRAILRKSKIIVLDEATASIDYKTEEIIQTALNELLSTSTMISIAHRIKTVMNADKILVLENGEIIEFDTPKQLLSNKNSYFYDFYSKSLL